MTTPTVDSPSIPWTPRDIWLAALSIPLWWGALYAGIYIYHRVSSLPVNLGSFITFLELVLLGPVWWFSLRKYGVKPSTLGFKKPGQGALEVGCGVMVLGIFSNAVYNILLALFRLKIPNVLEPMLASTHTPWWYFIGVVIAAPLAEETFFRGFVFTGLRQRYGWQRAALISSGLFALFHLDPIVLIPIFILGYLLAYCYQRTDSIWPSIILHASNNALAFGATLLLTTLGQPH